jgi:TPP-dependent indolepyruvate ferredoxin oxidoreductase alpha subunit
VQEILDLGIHAFAMSRFSGVWSGMKTIQEIVESSATAMIDPERVQIQIPRISRCRPAACTSAGPTMRWTRKPACLTTSGTPRWPTSAPTA